MNPPVPPRNTGVVGTPAPPTIQRPKQKPIQPKSRIPITPQGDLATAKAGATNTGVTGQPPPLGAPPTPGHGAMRRYRQAKRAAGGVPGGAPRPMGAAPPTIKRPSDRMAAPPAAPAPSAAPKMRPKPPTLPPAPGQIQAPGAPPAGPRPQQAAARNLMDRMDRGF